jgi:glucose/arabinose dehydrogenase
LFLFLALALLVACAGRPGTSAPPPTTPPVADAIRLEPFATGIPGITNLVQTPDGRLFAATVEGLVHEIDAGGRVRDTPFLDIRDRVAAAHMEQGLLGLAFHPDFAANGQFYVYYSEVADGGAAPGVLARYRAPDGGPADPATGARLLIIPHDEPIHYGGALQFGPDGYLYLASGSGRHASSDRPSPANAQNGANLLGKILRLDVDGGTPYAIPPDNPFAGDPRVRDEIWHMGLRNPWRISFDRATGDLYVADVGLERYEEVNAVPAGVGGLNFGWPCFEGFAAGPGSGDCGPAAGYTFPLYAYDHGGGRCAITGGYVYRGQTLPWLAGRYLFADLCSGDIWSLWRQDGETRAAMLNPDVKRRWTTFGEGINGELYVADFVDGTIFRITIQT